MPNSALLTHQPVLVTGGAGFIGSHLTEALVKLGARVTVVDNLATGQLDNLRAVAGQIKLRVGDIGSLLQLKRIDLTDFACVFHLAGNPYIPPSVENPAYDFHENLLNTFTILEALRALKAPPRLISASSAAVYGNPLRLPIREDDPTVPISPYGVSKLAGDRYLAVYSQLYGIPAVSMRFFSVYGPRQYKQVIFDLFRKLRDDPTSLEVFGDGSQTRDFAYVEDVAQALILAAERAPAQGEAYNVASGTNYSIAEIVTAICQVTGWAPAVRYTGHVRPGDAEKWEVDLQRLRGLGYASQTSLLAGLTNIRDWFYALPR